jgi:hypothetical protein
VNGTGESRVVLIVTLRINGKSHQIDVPSDMPVLWGAAGCARHDGDEVWLWNGALRRVHGAARWTGDTLLRDAGESQLYRRAIDRAGRFDEEALAAAKHVLDFATRTDRPFALAGSFAAIAHTHFSAGGGSVGRGRSHSRCVGNGSSRSTVRGLPQPRLHLRLGRARVQGLTHRGCQTEVTAGGQPRVDSAGPRSTQG